MAVPDFVTFALSGTTSTVTRWTSDEWVAWRIPSLNAATQWFLQTAPSSGGPWARVCRWDGTGIPWTVASGGTAGGYVGFSPSFEWMRLEAVSGVTAATSVSVELWRR